MRADDLSSYPWNIRAAGLRAKENMLADLNTFLRRAIPPQTLVWTVRSPDDVEDSFPISIHSEGLESVSGFIRLGNTLPAVAEYDLITTESAVQTVEIVYPPNPKKSVFWTPFAKLGWQWDIGWLITYLLAYLPPMFILKRILKVA